MSSELITAIDRLVEEKTFNLDALEAIKDLRDKASRLEATVELLEAQNEKQHKDIANARKFNEELIAVREQQRDKIAELEAREKQAFEAIFNAQKHEAVAEAYKDALRTVFRPHSVRETVSRSFPVATTYSNGTGGHTQTVQTYEQTDKVDREDT